MVTSQNLQPRLLFCIDIKNAYDLEIRMYKINGIGLFYRKFCCLLLIVMLSGCSDEVDLAPERDPGVISGKVVDGVVSGATVTVYAFIDGIRGRRLGGSTTDTDGNYSLEIRASSQLVLIEAAGGTYIEQATGTSVTIPSGDVLRAIVPYESGQPVTSMVTPLTHLVSGLTFYKIRQGLSPLQAYSEARTTIEEYLTIDTTSAEPIDITQAGDTVNSASDEALYGFYLAGISNLSLWAGNRNQVTPHTIYTSIGITQIMYNDIQSDGILDGVGFDLNNNPMPLAIGVIPLSAETYRATFSLHLLAISDAAENTTSLKANDLQIVAEDLATRPSELFPESAILDINNQAPEISLVQTTQTTYSGTILLPLEIGGFLDAESIDVSVDGVPVGAVDNPQIPEVLIDTTLYPPDGSHVLGITATDILGNTASESFILSFDNTNPVINITSSLVTNTPSITVSGTYSDNLAGVDSIVVDSQAATLNQDGTWSASINIVSGENTVPISVFDFAGNQLSTQATVYLDDINPEISTSNGHSNARFSNGGGSFFTAPLQDDNAATALFITTDRLELSGIPIVRTQLDNNLIPYFAFSVSDLRTTTVPTAFAELQVRIQYEKNGTVLNPWHVLPLPASGNEYLIPLASETLSPTWHQATQDELHSIQVEVTDPAGNVTVSSFSFRTDFTVPPLDTSAMVVMDVNADTFTATVFADRATLNNLQFVSTVFETITNPVNTAIYIQPQDTAGHSVQQTVEQLVREHQVRLITSTEWQIRLMAPLQTCPNENLTEWRNATSIYNWVNGDWQLESVPQSIQGPIELAPNDDLPTAPAATIWSNVPHFDNEFSTASITIGNTWNYSFDYASDPLNSLSAAHITNWEVRNSSGDVIDTCPDASFFQQREVFTYESEPGFPQPVVSNIAIENLPGFSTTSFTVVDLDANANIQPANGWYRVPAGHSVTILKQVTTPSLVNYNDDISNPASATYTPLLFDSSITWSVNREIIISTIHDSGEDNIVEMSQQENSVGSGIMDYGISR